MLGSITPLGERSRGRRWGITVTAFALADARLAGGRDDPQRADRELAAAGIATDHPSLHGPPG